MNRRAWILGAIALVCAVFAGWLLWGRDGGGDGGARALTWSAPDAGAGEGAAAQLSGARETPVMGGGGERRLALVEEPSAGEGEEADAQAAWGRLRVTVTDRERGEPVAGLFLQLEPVGIEPGAMPAGGTRWVHYWAGETDGGGQLAAELHPGVAFRAQVHGIGLDEPLAVEHVEPLEPGETRSLAMEVDIERLSRFFVRVVAEEDGRPLVGAELLVIDAFGERLETRAPIEQPRWSDAKPLATTGPQGVAALPITPLVQRRFAARAPGRGLRVFAADAASDVAERALVVRLAGDAALHATVVDGGGALVAGAEVRITARFADLSSDAQRGWLLGGEHAIRLRADDRGLARFEGLTANVPIEVWLRGPGGEGEWQRVEPRLAPLEPGERRSASFALLAVAQVEGVAKDQYGAPAADAELLLLRADAANLRYGVADRRAGAERRVRTDAHGAFRLDAVPAGSWVLVPVNPRVVSPMAGTPMPDAGDDLIAPVPTHFEVGPSGASVWLELVLWRGLYVRGRVLAPDEAELPLAVVQAALAGELGLVLAYPETDGSFALGPLPSGELELEAWAVGRSLRSAKVPARAGDRDVELSFESPEGTLVLELLDGRSDEPISARVELLRMGESGELLSRQAVLFSRGDREGRQVTAGTWTLVATGPGDLVAMAEGIEVRAGETTGPVTLRLLPGGHLLLTRTGEAPPADVRVRVRGATVWERSMDAGTSARMVLPVGEVEVEVDGQLRRAHLYAGETTTLPL